MQKIPQYKQVEIKFPGQGEAQGTFSQAGQKPDGPGISDQRARAGGPLPARNTRDLAVQD